MKRETKKVTVLSKEVFGSLTRDDSYADDKVVDIINWLQVRLAEVPKEYRAETYLSVTSKGGYEGEHHVEIEMYYFRPETDGEYTNRLAAYRAATKQQEEEERATYERLKLKFEQR